MASADKIFIAKWFIISAFVVLPMIIGITPVLSTTNFQLAGSLPPASGFRSFEEFQRGNKEIHIAIAATVVPHQVKQGRIFNLYLQVDLPQDWHIYSLEDREDSLPTRIQLEETTFTRQSESHRPDRWKESPPRIAMDGVLQKMVKTHEKTAEFTLAMQVPDDLSPGVFPIAGTLTYRLCDNKVCYLPKKLPFQTTVQVAPAKSREMVP